MRANLASVLSVGLLCAWPTSVAADSWSGTVCQQTSRRKLNCAVYTPSLARGKYVLVDTEAHILFKLEPFTHGVNTCHGTIEPSVSLADYLGKWVTVKGNKTRHTVKITCIDPIKSEPNKKKEQPGSTQAGPLAQAGSGKHEFTGPSGATSAEGSTESATNKKEPPGSQRPGPLAQADSRNHKFNATTGSILHGKSTPSETGAASAGLKLATLSGMMTLVDTTKNVVVVRDSRGLSFDFVVTADTQITVGYKSAERYNQSLATKLYNLSLATKEHVVLGVASGVQCTVTWFTNENSRIAMKIDLPD